MQEVVKARISELWRDNSFDAAIEFINKNAKQLSVVEQSYFLGLSYRKKGDFKESLAYFKLALDNAADDVDLKSEVAIAYFYENELPKALLLLSECVEAEPNNPFRFSSRAFIKERLKDIDGAIADYEIAVKLDPKDAIAYNNLGLLQEKKGRLDVSKTYFKKADNLAKKQNGDIKPSEDKKENEEIQPKPKLGMSPIQEAKKEKPKMTFRIFMNTLKSVFSDKAVFLEFLRFLGGKKSR